MQISHEDFGRFAASLPYLLVGEVRPVGMRIVVGDDGDLRDFQELPAPKPSNDLSGKEVRVDDNVGLEFVDVVDEVE